MPHQPAHTPSRLELWQAQRERRAERTARQCDAARSELRKRMRSALITMSVCAAVLLVVPSAAWAAEDADVHPFIQLALYMGALSLVPFAVMTLTSFLRIVVVLSFLRSGLGAQNVPPNMVIIALALFLSLFVMGPTIDAINKDALQPYQAGELEFSEAMPRAQAPLKEFMVKQINGKNSRKEISTFYELASKEQGMTPCRTVSPGGVENKPAGCLPTQEQIADAGTVSVLPMRIIIPAFIISELKKAFIMGFAVLLPFLVIDMVISNILLTLGMMMLPPVVISLPFKILLFVVSGGWTMVIKFLVQGFNY